MLPPGFTRYTVSLPEVFIDELKRRAVLNHTSVAEQLRQTLVCGFEHTPARGPSFVTAAGARQA
ncbi:hypothetical protein [Acidisoma sp. L85]|jgi:hypothetical protein|uniref:hypothetical protein n=1 Tax=Acidisoma sp. L85 TaxID=1641850 RepID=UPI00131DADD7|nr:hypothetical protein [Acidisoma sp. L85]